MGGGWRRAFCTRNPESTILHNQHRSQSPTTCVRLSFLSVSDTADSTSNPSTPRSPSFKLSLFRNSFKFRSSCGICLNSVKTGLGTAIYTAECGHAFHSPCIVGHVSSNNTCPVCNATWKVVPALPQQNDVVTTKIFEAKKQSDSVRPYDDDEPLPSPFSGCQIAPIPEADENNDDEDQNDVFQGFFVNPSKPPMITKDADSRNVRVKLMPECAVITSSQSHETYALVLRVKAPPPPSCSQIGASPPVDLVTVVNVGAGMSGTKLHMLKRAMRLVISSLGSVDRLAIVAYSDSSKRLMPLRRMTAQGQRVARRIVDRLISGRQIAASGGVEALRKAAKVLEDRRERNPLASVVLFSETSNWKNQRESFGFSHVSSRFTFIEVPVQSFGFGKRTLFGFQPDEDHCAKRIEELFSVTVHDLTVQLGVSSHHAEIRDVYSCNNGRPTSLGSEAFTIGDLYAEEERELLVELRVATSALGSHHVMNVKCVYKDSVKQDTVCGREQALPVALRLGGRAERLRNVFVTSRAISKSRKLLDQNEFSNAYCVVVSARELLAQCGSASVDEYVRGLEAELAEIQWQKAQYERQGRAVDESGEEALTPTSAWRAAEKLAKMATMKKSLNRVTDLHGFENARF
ncbi:hypothetical protein HN51_026148 [Arachis hypogaea]|uniref:RING-type domain-containing protein n=1 Tax=Arachis hypogaea TaxID=3818 RepID=A0A445CGV0_ARAHY|nr:E3 ubiquitin-protein ligase WAV3 [Arachis hypogaea]QHO28698.1 uncharacterized protein DS421_7g218950 [Arachis hypogaea]RYR50130.1 hypothetical protein Ahy_A07g036705 [Arachis hypogaea]